MPGDPRPNFFILLGLDPEAQFDQAAYERMLREKQHLWARQQVRGLSGHETTIAAARNLRLIPQIKAVMGGEATRKREQAAAKEDLAARNVQLKAELVNRLKITTAKGFLWEVEQAAIKADYPNFRELLAGEELLRWLESIEPRHQGPDDVLPERLERSMVATIQTQLRVLGKADLYDVLQEVDKSVTAGSSSAGLLKAAKRLYDKAIHTMDKGPEVAAMQRLAGFAMDLFGDDERRRRYNASVKLQTLEGLIREYERHLRSVRRVDAAQSELFLEDARRKGLDLDLARAEFVAYFSERKWVVDMPSSGAEEALRHTVPCSICLTLNEPRTEFCTLCGERLRTKCPRCGATVAPQGACGPCGFRVGERPLAEVLVEEFEHHLGQQRLDDAAASLERARRIWQLPPESDDELAVRIRDSERRLSEHRRVSAEILDLKATRQYRTLLAKLRATPVSFPGRQRLLTEAAAFIDQADRLYRQAVDAESGSERQIELTTQALAVCDDYQEARDLLDHIPPTGPRELRAVPVEPGGGVQLSWQPSSASDVRYVVVRKPEAPPGSVHDGARVAEVSGLAWLDQTPEVGLPVHYAIFAERRGVASRSAAEAGPVFVAGEVEIVSRHVREGQVELIWNLPPNADGVTILREEIAPAPPVPKPATLVPPDPTRLLDVGLRNQVRYAYTLYATFRDSQGVERRSKGTRVELTPSRPPEPPRRLSLTARRTEFGFGVRKVELRWEPPQQGAVSVVRFDGPPTLRYGDEVPAADLKRHGMVIDQPAPAIDQLPRHGRYRYVPAVVANGMAYVGEARRYACRDEVNDLAIRNLGHTMVLRWSWPPGCEEVLVAYDHIRLPGDPTLVPLARQLSVRRREYERQGGFELPGSSGPREYFVLVAVVEREGEETFVSSGVAAEGWLRPRLTVEYRLHPKRLLKEPELSLKAERPVHLPEVVLRGRPDGAPPTGRDDGEIALEVDPVPVERELRLPLPSLPPRRYRLFFADPADEEDFELIDRTSS